MGVEKIQSSAATAYWGFNAAVDSAQTRLLPQGQRFVQLTGQSGELDLNDQIDEVVREIQSE